MLGLRASLFVLILLLSAIAGDKSFAQNIRQPVSVKSYASLEQIAPGEKLLLAVELSMQPGWHVQSHSPSSEGYVATNWVAEENPAYKILQTYYPEDEEEKLLGEVLKVYSGKALLGVELQLAQNVPSGQLTIPTSLIYQACNDAKCLFPEQEAINFKVQIARTSGELQHTQIFSKVQTLLAQQAAPESNGAAKELSEKIIDKGLFLTLLGIFFLGLGLNLTPCVYPVIAVTMGFFSRQQKTGGRVLLPLLYGAGIALTFTLLGVITALTGGLFGEWMQSSWVQGGIAVLMLVLALSCFGVYELQAPSWLLNRVGGGKRGALGSLAMGLTMGITAAPCVGPFIVSLLLYIAQEADVTKGLIWFGTLSLGLALPYPLLGFFSSSLQSLPKAGDWTEWVKRLMGFLLIAVALFYLSSLFFPEKFLLLLAGFTLIAGVYMSVFDHSGRRGNSIWFVRGAVFVLALFGSYFLYAQHTKQEIEWQYYTEELLTQAAEQQKPVIIDFTASWCAPCRGLESFTFRHPGVVQEAQRFMRLRVDLTNRTEPKAKAAYEKFKLVGLPAVLLIDSQGREKRELRTEDFISGEEFLKKLQAVP